jgi:8-oxo-dGTP pyrophosphatase MutT (NUDIX family)
MSLGFMATSDDEATLLTFTEDRYNGVELKVPPTAATRADAFRETLARRIAGWEASGKGGLWLRIPTECAGLCGAAASMGFDFHHAKPGYALMTRWLLPTPSPLPKYAFTQIGCGGVVVNSKGEVLMVQEKVSPMAVYQGSWKLPGGLADPGEDFADAVAREVREETGIESTLAGVVSMRHMHGVRFGQGDLYVVVRLSAKAEEITLDPNELMGACWMGRDEIRSKLAPEGAKSHDGLVSATNLRVIENALDGTLIAGETVHSSVPGRQPSMLYMSASPGGGAAAGKLTEG